MLNNCFNSRIAGNRCKNNGEPSEDFKAEDADVTKRFAAGIRVRGSDLELDANVMQGNTGGEVARWQAKSFNDARIMIKKAATQRL